MRASHRLLLLLLLLKVLILLRDTHCHHHMLLLTLSNHDRLLHHGWQSVERHAVEGLRELRLRLEGREVVSLHRKRWSIVVLLLLLRTGERSGRYGTSVDGRSLSRATLLHRSSHLSSQGLLGVIVDPSSIVTSPFLLSDRSMTFSGRRRVGKGAATT